MKLVIAGNYRQFSDWIRRSGKSSDEYKYINDEVHLRGILQPEEIHLVGTYWDNIVYRTGLYKYFILNGTKEIKENY